MIGVTLLPADTPVLRYRARSTASAAGGGIDVITRNARSDASTPKRHEPLIDIYDATAINGTRNVIRLNVQKSRVGR